MINYVNYLLNWNGKLRRFAECSAHHDELDCRLS